MIGNLRSDRRFVCVVEKCVVVNPPKCGLRVEE